MQQAPERLRKERDEALVRLSSLEAEIAAQPIRAEELERLRLENAGLKSNLSEFERLKSDVVALQAQNARLNAEVSRAYAQYEELTRKAEELNRREQDIFELQARLDEITASWNPVKVKELEIQRDAFARQVDYLQSTLTEREQQIEEIQRKLKAFDQVGFDHLKDRVAELDQENAALRNNLRQYEAHVAELLANKERLRRAGELERKNLQLQEEKAAYEVDLQDLRSQVTQLGALQSLVERVTQDNAELKQQLDLWNDSEKQRLDRGARAFDALRELLDKPEYNKPLDNRIQAWPGDRQVVILISEYARQHDFEYDPSRIRAFLAAIRSSRFIVLKGFSGTGKTSLPILVARAIGAKCEVIPVQPSWKSKVDLLGFFNHFDQRFLPTLFTKALLKAHLPAFQDRHFFIVLDEMNLSRVEYYFSDFNVRLQDTNKPMVELFDNATVGNLPAEGIGRYIRNGNQIEIPRNVTFIGTINDDETTYALSDKIYDRAQVIDFTESSRSLLHGTMPSESEVRLLLSFAGYVDEGTAFTLPEADRRELDKFLTELNKVLRERFFLNLSYRPRAQILEFVRAYVSANGDRSEALDLQIISKVLPKIRFSHKSGFDEDLKQFGEELQMLWPYPDQSPDMTREALELMKARA